MKCRLCNNQDELCDSHIIPEFLYDPIYDEKHRLIIVDSLPNEKLRLAQKGLREPLLCRSCETKMSEWERYAKFLFFGGRIKAELQQDCGDFYSVRNVDYVRFKLFQLSLLWRAGESTLPFFARVQLGPHGHILREMLISERPGEPHEYGCILMVPLLSGQLVDTVIEPIQLRIDGYRCYRFFVSGFVWCFVVSNHTLAFEQRNLFLSKEGELTIIREDARKIGFLRQYADALKSRTAEISRLNPPSSMSQ